MAATSEDERWMRLAIGEAREAGRLGEVPVGAVAVLGDRVVGQGYNLRERSQDPTAHAELIAMRAAAARLGSWRLGGVTIYVTLEPCPMCAGALVNARAEGVVWGCDDPKAGATRTLYNIGDDGRLNHRVRMVPGVLTDECAALLTDFFARIRSRA
ncbi:MAG: tRNA adenosine(34) deaminase TadA [Myxococcota bacterium]